MKPRISFETASCDECKQVKKCIVSDLIINDIIVGKVKMCKSCLNDDEFWDDSGGVQYE